MSNYDMQEWEERKKASADELIDMLREVYPALVHANETVLADRVHELLNRVVWPKKKQ